MQQTGLRKKDVIYHILIDRFAGFPENKTYQPSTEFFGGNLRGIINKLPYLQKLGVDVLWISPFYKTSAYHGYHITDFFSVDPHFGTEQDLKELIDLVHQQNMRIIADFVPNHCSSVHPFFLEAQQYEHSPYRSWFYFDDWPNSYRCFLSVSELPKLNLRFPSARDHIINAALYWLKKGLDGFRLDHVIGPSNQFWTMFSQKIKAHFPRCVLIGEAWMQGISFQQLTTLSTKWKYMKWLFGANSDWLLKSYQGLLDGVLDFQGQQLIQQGIRSNQSTTRINEQLRHHYRRFHKSFLLALFLDNHDMDRVLFQFGNDVEKLKKAATLQFSMSQPVIIYYGTEIGMSQQQSVWKQPMHGDLLARKPMQWENRNEKIFLFYKNLITKRKNDLE